MENNPKPYKTILEGLGLSNQDGWVDKLDVVNFVNSKLGQAYNQKRVWQLFYDGRKSAPLSDANLFPKDPLTSRNRSWCYYTEAWVVIAILYLRHDYIHLWLRHFNLGEYHQLVEGEQLIVDGAVRVGSGVQVSGKGLLVYSSNYSNP